MMVIKINRKFWKKFNMLATIARKAGADEEAACQYAYKNMSKKDGKPFITRDKKKTRRKRTEMGMSLSW